MESDLCDELLKEILYRVQSDCNSVPLVCKRWLLNYRSTKTTLCLRLPFNFSPTSLSFPSFSSLLSHYSHLTTLTIEPETTAVNDPGAISDQLMLCIAGNCKKLRQLRFLTGSVSISALKSLALTCKSLNSFEISSFRPFCFCWLVGFQSLKELSILERRNGGFGALNCSHGDLGFRQDLEHDSELQLRSLCLTGIGHGDLGMGWFWRNCRNLRKLQLRSCEGTGDDPSCSSFVKILSKLEELELRTCRSIADKILTRTAQHCKTLKSLVLYDGGSREGLHEFIRQCRSLKKIDLRLPLDLDDEHLSAIAENCRGLVSLKLQSCCLVNSDGLKSLGPAMNVGLEELVLINCDVVEREPGLLTSLGQNFRKLCKLDLSHNDSLLDKELGSMLASCGDLVEIKLRGCGGLTDVTVVSLFKNCKLLQTIDISQCCRITTEGVEFLVLHFPSLNQIFVEESKISENAKKWVLRRGIEVENQRGSY